jgi:hypothetical protein
MTFNSPPSTSANKIHFISASSLNRVGATKTLTYSETSTTTTAGSSFDLAAVYSHSDLEDYHTMFNSATYILWPLNSIQNSHIGTSAEENQSNGGEEQEQTVEFREPTQFEDSTYTLVNSQRR